MKRFTTPAIITVFLISGVGCRPKMPDHPIHVTPPPFARPGELIFIADSQIATITGGRINSANFFSDALVPVAVRPRETNLLSQLVLENALERTAMRLGEQGNVFYLGDATNFACGGELRDFDEAMRNVEKSGGIWLAAHGNHDSFLAGNYGNFVPGKNALAALRLSSEHGFLVHADDGNSRKFRAYETFSWWSAETARSFAYDSSPKRSWAAICAEPEGNVGVPTNKLVWLAWYAAALHRQGVEFSSWGAREQGGLIEGSGTLSNGTRVDVKGWWVSPTKDFLPEAGKSFVVQRAVLPNNITIVILDTSVAGNEIGNARRPWQYAGKRGRIGEEQLAVVKAMLAGSTRPTILAGHMPLEYLEQHERNELLAIMKQHGVTTYVSAHTHQSPSIRNDESVQEINVGSTTDWPMSLSAIAVSPGGDMVPRTILAGALGECRIETDDSFEEVSMNHLQACEHAPVAEKLASESNESVLEYLKGSKRWSTPGRKKDCDSRAAAQALRAARKAIRHRYENDAVYREFALCLATKITSTQCGRWGDDSPCDARGVLQEAAR